MPRLKSKRYMESYINPPEFLEEQQQEAGATSASKRQEVPRASPQRDVLLFLLEHAPLEHWERDILAIVRDEAYYFAPQAHDQDHERGLGLLLALARS